MIKRQLRNNRIFYGLLLSIGLFHIIFILPCRADKSESYLDYKENGLAAMEVTFEKIKKNHGNDGALNEYLQRVELVDQIALLLIEGFESTRSDSLNSLLGDIVDIPGSHQKVHQVRAMRATEVLSEYSNHFSKTISFSSLSKDEINFLRKYYNTFAKMAGKYIAQRGQTVFAIDKTFGNDILELCLVMPFLHVHDEKWSQDDIDILPAWMKTKSNFLVLELFSLHVRRPFTAYQFSLYSNKKKEGLSQAYSDYLLSAAESRIKHRDFHAGLHCIRIGIAQAEAARKNDTAIELRYRISDTLARIGHPGLAAKEILQLMERYPTCSSWGKAAMFRIKYLYEAGDFKAIANEAPKYCEEKRCQSFLAQILYMSWVTHRRLNQPDISSKLADQFLEKFPTHALGADIHFASAMTAMASGDYEEASRLLEIIEYNYPKSRTQKKVKKIRERLSKMSSKDK